MPIIEGIGDEVLLLFIISIIVILLCVGWLSTHVSDYQQPNLFYVSGTSFQRLLHRFAQQQQHDEMTNGVEVPPPLEETEVSADVNDTTRPASVEDVESLIEPAKPAADVTDDSPTLVAEDFSHDETEPVVTPSDGGTISLEELRQCRAAFYSAKKTDVCEPIATTSGSDGNVSSPVVSVVMDDANLSSPTVSMTTEDASQDEIAEDLITVRLKYLDDRQRSVFAKPDDTIGHFKSVNFADEISNNFIVRFVYNGQELRQDTSTLQSYNITDNSVVHCLLTRGSVAATPRVASPSSEVAAGESTIIDWLYLPLFGIMLAIAWYSRFAYRHYFNLISTFALVAISLLYAIVLHTAFLTGMRQRHAHTD